MLPIGQVAIVGVGLLGGSLGMALRQRRGAGRVIGIGRSVERLAEAQRLGAIDDFATDLAAAGGSDLAVVATPVEQVAETVAKLAALPTPPRLVTDVASTKRQIELDLAANWPAGADCAFVGSHPLAGGHRTGCGSASPDLFHNRAVVVTPGVAAGPNEHRIIADVWRAVGARVIEMNAAEHDRALAHTSHLPHLVAAVLAAGTATEYLELVGTGWRDTTRIAAGDPELWRQIFAANRQEVLHTTDSFLHRLTEFRAALERGDDPRVLQLLTQGKQVRDAVGS